MTPPAVVVAIVAYGRAPEVALCLSSLARSTFAGFEIVIVENAGAEAYEALSAALAAGLPAASGIAGEGIAEPRRTGPRALRSRRFALASGQPVLVIEASHNLGYGGGVNLVLAAVADAPDWRGLWILNPDTEPEPEALAKLLEYAEAGGYGLVGCRLVLSAEGLVQTRGGAWRRLVGRGRSLGYGEPADAVVDSAAIERRLEWVSGAACYATRAFIEGVGPMSEDFFLYCEDVEWSLRGRRFRLGYAHAAVVRHASGTTIGSAASIRARSSLSIYLTERNALLLTRRRFPWLYPLVVLVMLALTADYLLRGDRRIFAAACRGWWAGVRGETGRPRCPR
ncbi:MAG TPA: glycosyltransferase family 2 protein [Stellaceae bacterium]|nr:glycosyltransferase family 2 protein [Stellaceae bacterium]